MIFFIRSNNSTLTSGRGWTILDTHSQKTSVGIGVPNVAALPLICGFFVPIAQYSFMVGWVEQSKDWPGATSVRQLCSVRLPMIGVVWRRVYNLFSKVAIMSKNHTQKPTNNVSLKSIYLLLDSNKSLITSSLLIEQAKPLSEHIKGSVIKFQAMVRVEVSA